MADCVVTHIEVHYSSTHCRARPLTTAAARGVQSFPCMYADASRFVHQIVPEILRESAAAGRRMNRPRPMLRSTRSRTSACTTVWARPGPWGVIMRDLSVLLNRRSSVYGAFVRTQTGRLTAQNGGFGPGQGPTSRSGTCTAPMA